MTTFRKKLGSALATSAILLQLTTVSAFADTTIQITGNGYSSDSDANVKTETTTTVVQNNTADVKNTVHSDSNTGGNSANQNTGGDVLVHTGDAKSKVSIDNQLNSNSAKVDCCGTSGDTKLEISGNGAYSDNDIKLKNKVDNSIFQDNSAKVENKVDADSNTGDNKAKQNTGGDVAISTGDAKTYVDVSTTANVNAAQIGGNGRKQGSTDLRIIGNGAYSDNDIKLRLENENELVQKNAADIYNTIYADADTGDNKASQNTGGDTTILTGDAKTGVSVDNMVNFNWANIDCGCLSDDLLVKVAGNGANSDNDVKVKLENEKKIFQDNYAHLKNKLDSDADTGHKKAKQNTVGVNGGDPAIWTGDSYSSTDVSNSGNVNSYGHALPSNWPEWEFSFNFNGLSLSELLALLGH